MPCESWVVTDARFLGRRATVWDGNRIVGGNAQFLEFQPPEVRIALLCGAPLSLGPKLDIGGRCQLSWHWWIDGVHPALRDSFTRFVPPPAIGVLTLARADDQAPEAFRPNRPCTALASGAYDPVVSRFFCHCANLRNCSNKPGFELSSSPCRSWLPLMRSNSARRVQ